MHDINPAAHGGTRPDFGEIVGGYGFLTDRQIRAALQNRYLIDPGTADQNSIRHASYTLRVGSRIEVAAAARANTEERRDFNVQEIRQGDSVELHPGDTAKLFSIEILDLPADVLAFTVARGLMFFESLVPENTYADPGFREPLYVTVTNLSNRIIKLYYGDPMARIFFYRLEGAVEEPFRRGAARGIKQRLESERTTKFGTLDECRNASFGDLVADVTRIPLAGTQLAILLTRQNRHIILLAFAAVLWPLLLLIANRSSWLLSKFGDIVVNLIASAVFVALIGAADWIWKALKK
jgi:deoxycytidine triphosphate deaminase